MKRIYNDNQLDYIRSRWGIDSIKEISEQMGLNYHTVRDLAVKRMKMKVNKIIRWNEEQRQHLREIYPYHYGSEALKLMRQYMPGITLTMMNAQAHYLGIRKAYDRNSSHEKAVLTRHERMHKDHLRVEIGMDPIYYGTTETPLCRKRYMLIRYLWTRYNYKRENRNCRILYYDDTTQRKHHIEIRAKDLGISIIQKP